MEELTLDISNRRTLINSLNNESFQLGAEIGVLGGMFSRYILKNTQIKLYSIDPWKQLEGWTNEDGSLILDHNEYYEKTINLLSEFGDRSVIMREDSQDAAQKFEDNSLDFVYIDAMHDYENVKNDMKTWYKKIRNSGILAGHDYSLNWEGCKRAVDEFVMEHSLKLITTGVVGNAYASGTGDIDDYDGEEPSWCLIKGYYQ